MKKKLLNFEEKLSVTVKWAIVLFFSAGCISYALELGLRLVLGKSVYWLSYWTPYFFVIASLYGAAFAVRTNENIKIELLRKWASHPSVQKINDLLSLLVSLLILIVFYQNFSHSFSKEGWAFLQDVPYLHIFFVTVVAYGARLIKRVEAAS